MLLSQRRGNNVGLNQTEQELDRIGKEWFQNHSEGVLDHPFNIAELCKEVVRQGHDTISLENLTAARLALGEGLVYAQKKEKRFDYAQQTNDGARPNHAQVEKQVQVVRLAVNDVNSPVFQQKNNEAKVKFEDLCKRGPISYRRNREDRGLTIARREILQKIRVVAAQRDRKGQEVLIYSNMVEKAEEQIQTFESEDARREMS
jgi:hypothetical protein